MQTGPGGIVLGAYNPTTLTQAQRQWLFEQNGNTGVAPAGYGGNSQPGEYGNYSVGETASQIAAQNQAGQSAALPNTILGLAGSLNQQVVAENQPAIQALGSQIPGIQGQYQSLVNSINAGSLSSYNSENLAVNNAMGARGILPSSGLYQTQLANSLVPVQAQYTGLTSQAAQGSTTDINAILSQQAQLAAGNPAASITGATSAGGDISSLQASLAAANAQIQAQNIQSGASVQNTNTTAANALAQIQAQQEAISLPANNTLINLLTGAYANPANNSYGYI